MKNILLAVAAIMLPAGQAWCGENPIFKELASAGKGEAVSAPVPGTPAQAVENTAMVAPDEVVKAMMDQVLKMIGTASKEEILAVVLPSFNFERMTKIASGKSWNEATEEQKTALVREFRTLLVRTYSMAMDAAVAGNKIEVKPLGPQTSPTEALVRTVIKPSGQAAFPVDYRVENTSGAWKVYDVIIEGVSLVTNYKSQFSSVISKSGIDGLIKILAEKNSKP